MCPALAAKPAAYKVQSTATIIDFLDDAELLRPSFEGESWSRWRAVLKAAFAPPMSAKDRKLFAEVAGDRAPPRHRVRELVCAIGRGGGKDAIASALAVYIAVTGDFTRLRPGEHGTVMMLATDKARAAIAFNYTRAYLEETALLAPLISSGGRRQHSVAEQRRDHRADEQCPVAARSHDLLCDL